MPDETPTERIAALAARYLGGYVWGGVGPDGYDWTTGIHGISVVFDGPLPSPSDGDDAQG